MSQSEAKWYVVHTYSGYENKVAQNLEKMVENQGLQSLIREIKVPTELVVEQKESGQKEVEHKLFPGYVLVKMVMTDDTWYVVRNIRGVTGFVGPGSKPVPLSPAEVEALGVEKRSFKMDYNVGDNVEIKEGALEGFTGTVQSIDAATGKLRISVSMFGRETPVELDPAQIKPL